MFLWIHLLEKRQRKKFDIAYMMPKEKLAFAKICELEERHSGFKRRVKNDNACLTFTSYIAREQQEISLNAI